MSHLFPSCLFYIPDALIPALCIDFLLLLIDTLEVTASSSNREVIGFTSVAGRTLLPLAQLCGVHHHCRVAEHSKTCSPTWDSSCAHAVSVSSRNRLKAGECPYGKSLAEHVSKLHPLQPNGRCFLFLKGNNQLLYFPLFLFSRRKQTLQQAFLHCSSTE